MLSMNATMSYHVMQVDSFAVNAGVFRVKEDGNQGRNSNGGIGRKVILVVNLSSLRCNLSCSWLAGFFGFHFKVGYHFTRFLRT